MMRVSRQRVPSVCQPEAPPVFASTLPTEFRASAALSGARETCKVCVIAREQAVCCDRPVSVTPRRKCGTPVHELGMPPLRYLSSCCSCAPNLLVREMTAMRLGELNDLEPARQCRLVRLTPLSPQVHHRRCRCTIEAQRE